MSPIFLCLFCPVDTDFSYFCRIEVCLAIPLLRGVGMCEVHHAGNRHLYTDSEN